VADEQQDDRNIDGYQYVATIAVGGTSTVNEVIEPGTSRRLAMKLLNPGHPDFKEHKGGLKHEASVLKTLEHPNIIRYESFTAGRDHIYMLMEYFRAPNVKLQLKTNKNSVHVRLRKMLESVCAALQHVHDKGWIHRDIKPDNVLMNKVGEVKLIDFSLAVRQQSGLARLMGGKQASIQGTRTYLAPETIRKKPSTVQTDLYSLGVMMFEVLTGKTPFQGATPDEVLQKHLTATPPAPSEFNPNVTPEMDRLVLKLLSKKPENRGKDIGEVAAELRRIKIFKEEPQEVTGDQELSSDHTSEDFLRQLQEAKLDSRLDAKRSEMIKQNPELARQLAEQEAARKKEEAARKAKRIAAVERKGGGASAPPPQVAPPYPMPQPMPPGVMPPYAVPQPPYAMPPTVYPGVPPGYPPAMIPPGAVMPGMPVMPQAPGMPPMPVAPGMPTSPPVPAGQPAAAAGRPAEPPPAPQPPAAPPTKSDDDLEYMTELPEVL